MLVLYLMFYSIFQVFFNISVTVHNRSREWVENFDLTTLVTPIDVSQLKNLLQLSNYPKEDADIVIDGFENGFSIGYNGPTLRQDKSENIPFTVGDKFDLWDKLMKEVKLGRVAGPFKEIPYRNFMQSPIGLVPKAGNKTRLIFHLSYEFKSGLGSLNANTPKELCSVKYQDLDQAIKGCLELLRTSTNGSKVLFYSKSDLVSAFRILPLRIQDSKWLLMKAKDPITGITYLFVERNLPFGASISCSHFTKVSNCLSHIVRYLNDQQGLVVNYLDDFLFVSLDEQQCNVMVNRFIDMCRRINFPVALEKTEFASTDVIFLGILLDGVRHLLIIPEDKRIKALNMVEDMIDRKKAKVKVLQQLAGILNFLHRAIFPGRVVTRRMYAKFSSFIDQNGKLVKGAKVKPYHHIKIDDEFRDDCRVWQIFLSQQGPSVLCRPFIDLLSPEITSQELDFMTDAAAGRSLGTGAVFGKMWTWSKWPVGFIDKCRPSIEFLELYALVTAVFIWSDQLSNMRSSIFCDNMAVVNMINSNVSSCKHCMYLLRLFVLRCLRYNMRISAKHIFSKNNILADVLSRQRLDIFKRIAPQMEKYPKCMPDNLYPVQKVWNVYE